MLATRIEEEEGRHGVRPLGLLDVLVQRNGYGTQVDSFVGVVRIEATGEMVQGVFIRAPRILDVGEGVEVIVTRDGEPVGVRIGNVTGLAYHPEANGDLVKLVVEI